MENVHHIVSRGHVQVARRIKGRPGLNGSFGSLNSFGQAARIDRMKHSARVTNKARSFAFTNGPSQQVLATGCVGESELAIGRYPVDRPGQIGQQNHAIFPKRWRGLHRIRH